MRGQAGDEHGGPPWFKEESSPAGWRELLRAWGDEGDGSLSHRGAVSFKANCLTWVFNLDQTEGSAPAPASSGSSTGSPGATASGRDRQRGLG